MKQKLTFLLTAVMLLAGMKSWGQLRTEASIDFAEQGYTNAQDLDGVEIAIDDNVTIVFNKGTGSNGPKYYNTGTAIRAYGGNNFVVSSTGTISSISMTFSSGEGTNAITTEIGTYTAPTWTGSSSEVTFTVGGTSGHRRIRSVSVTYASGGGTPTVATPTFSPAAGTYFEAQSVSISCTTEGATIYYTSDGTEPTESSTLYSSSISVSETTTLKAKAFKTGSAPSAVATAAYTLPTLISISQAKALAVNEYAWVQGVVNFIDNRNVYVQDETGGICLFLNSNTVPSTLALGDMVQAYGKRANYNGLFELSSIDGSSNHFTILSSGNTLPLEVKTIAEVLAGGSDVLQCTRVKIEDATIGAINTSGNTPLMQSNDTTNIYKVPTLTGIEEGNEVDVIGVVGYFNVPQIRVATAGDIVLHETPVVPDPVLTVSVTELTNFRYLYGNGPSSAKNFTISGSDLTNDVTINAPENYEISLNPSNGYFDSDEISPVNGTIDERTVYVRLKAGLEVGSYNDTVTIVSGDITRTIAMTGTVDALPVAATPTFSPIAGTYLTEQNVTISCETTGATIYYTTDGSDPTIGSTVYSTPIIVSTTTTIKAMAVAENYDNSSIASAIYTINEVITIAAARALANDAYGCVEGTVIFIDARNIYVQDATAGIVLYLNNNTVPSSLAIGDNVRAYGKRATYYGLAELSGINGGNANEFTVLSHNNTLPLAVKTIAEINNDYSGDNMLQSTRVMIEDAIIGAINTGGNTVIRQGSDNLNVYRIPTVQGMIEGDLVTMTGIIGCHNAPQLRVVSAADVQYEHRPTLTADPTSLSGFTYDYDEGGPSEIMDFEFSGVYLVGPARVYPSENFEVSSAGGDLFHSENPASIFHHGSFYGIKIYVRMKAGLEAGSYDEQLVAVSENADTLFINVSGTVTGGTPTPPDPPTPPTPGDGNYVRISDLSNLTDGSYVVFAARFDENATNYYAMTATSSGKPIGVLFTSATADENEVLPASIVDNEATYYWIVGVTANGYTFTNADGELIGYTSSTNFATGGDNTEWEITNETSGEGTMVPNYTGFVITNVNNNGRAFALNSSHNFGPYAKSNMAGTQAGNYNFYLDLFVKTEGGEPPVPPTPTVATPTFTPEGGTYFEEQTVAINCATEGATIHYTLDGSTPTETSPVYSTPITVSESMTIRAYAEMDGCNDSPVATAEYIIQMGFVTIFDQDWEGEMNGWTFVNVEGEMEWTIATYSGNKYAYANGYNHGANEDWCISPVFNLNAYSNPMLSFRTATKFDGNILQVMLSSDYDGEDPTAATWHELTCELSTGNYIWAESGSIDLSEYTGDSCYIGFKYTCEESQAAAWEVDDIILIGQTSEPVVTVTPLALTGFTYIEGNGPSDEQSFTVSGFNLSGNITVTPSTNYEISQTSGSGFTSNSISLAPIGGNVEDTTIFVRLKAGLAVDDYNEDITVSCNDVDTINVTCNGNVTEQPVPGDDYVRISNMSELAAGNRIVFAARFDENATDYYAMSNAASGKPTGVLFTSTFNGSDEILPASILNEEDNFYWTVDVTADGYTFTNAAGDMIGYTSSTNFSPNGDNTAWSIEIGTSEETAMVPNYTGFVISNVNNPVRAFALNNNHNFGPYHTQNMASENYNFFLDIFMQGEGGTCTVAAPTFDPAGGTYYETQDVVISCTTSDATIYYSLESEDGPWNEYEEAITVDESLTIWAKATKDGCNPSPVVHADYTIQDDLVIIFNQDWEDDWNGWTEVLVYGDSLWRIASYQGNHYAYANGYNHPATEDWLISPEFNLDSYSDVVLTFRTAMNYNGLNLEVYFSDDYYDGQDPDSATWYPLICELSLGGWNWVESGDINLDEFSGMNCHIGFKYQCTEDEAAGWEVDDIMLVSGSATPTPTLTATPNVIALEYTNYPNGPHGPSASHPYTLTGTNLDGEGSIIVTASENFLVSTDDFYYYQELSIPYSDGELPPTPLYVILDMQLEVGTYEGFISHQDQGGQAYTEVSLTGTVHSENEPYMQAVVPQYIQGNTGSNNNRVPVASEVYVFHLEPNTTYRYTNQFVDNNDGPETAGAGNVIYANADGFYRSTNPSLATEGGYGEFTTDYEGKSLVWLINEPTANARFTPGNQVYHRLRINDGHDGTTVAQIFTSEDYATVLNFGTENDEYSGSAFYVKSNEASMSFAFMYASQVSRPTYITPIETVGIDYGSINQYANFYKDEVAGKDGWFGGILPNVNDQGINCIMINSLDESSSVLYTTENGHWNPDANTINPNAGLDEPIFIDLTDDGVDETVEANIKVWNADHEFVIENGDNAHYTMTVYNILGQPIMMKQINAGSTERISHSLAKGVYVISLQNNQNSIAVKVIVR